MKTAFVLLFALSLGAQDQAQQSTTKNPIGTGVQDPVVDYYDSVGDYFRNSTKAVVAIHKKGIPNEEIPAVLLIARKSSASPNQVIAARTSGKAWSDIAAQNKVTLAGEDFAKEANIVFLSSYHGVPAEKVRAMHGKGANFIAINQELRRGGNPAMPLKTEPAK
jgi:hypothetical protein